MRPSRHPGRSHRESHLDLWRLRPLLDDLGDPESEHSSRGLVRSQSGYDKPRRVSKTDLSVTVRTLAGACSAGLRMTAYDCV